MTQSPRLAALANNKRLGDEVTTNHALRHKLNWLRQGKRPETRTVPAVEPALRKRTS
jgi:hypothetical protein